jgi:RNA polymerase sigma-70 factor (ECF subfamily)
VKCSDVYTSEGDASATSTQLLRDARACDPIAWERLVAVYSRRMYRWCRRAGLQAADAANVVQEAFGSVARKLGDFHRDRPEDSFRGWLRRIVENKIRDHYRRQGRRHDAPVGGTDAHRRLADAATACDGDASDGAEVTAACMPAAHAQLAEVADVIREEVGERNWRFFWRTAVDGQSAAEVGEEFGVTANTVRIVKMRVLRRLRERLSTQTKTP